MISFEKFNLKEIVEKREYQKSPEAWDEQIFYLANFIRDLPL